MNNNLSTDFGWLTEEEVTVVLNDTSSILPLEFKDPEETDLRKIKVKIPEWGYCEEMMGLTGMSSGLFGCGASGALPKGYVNWIREVYKYFKKRNENVPTWFAEKYPYSSN
jgi:hypothetical protein